MWPVSDQYLLAVRYSQQKFTRLTHTNLATGVQTVLIDTSETSQTVDGAITVDATSRVRRNLTATLDGSEALWQALDTVGGEVSAYRGIDFQGRVEWVPLGVFIVDADNMDYSPGGTISISAAPDRYGKVLKNIMASDKRGSVASNAAWQEIQRLVEGAWPGSTYPFPGWTQVDTSATSKVGVVLYDDGNRDTVITRLCTDNAIEFFFNQQGKGVLRPVPTLTNTSPYVFSVNAGDKGVLLGADRSRDRTTVHNVIITTTAATDITFLPQQSVNNKAGDPLSITGPLGYQPLEYSSPTLRSGPQAKKAGDAMLAKYTGAAKQLSLTALQNDALDAGDIIQVVLPKTSERIARPTELHIIDTITLPLNPNAEMEIQTRSTVPDTLGT